MGRNPFGLGEKDKGGDGRTLFYFIREFKIYPFDEEYEVKDKKGNLVFTITKKAMPLALFNSLLQEMNKHYKKENEEIKRVNRKR